MSTEPETLDILEEEAETLKHYGVSIKEGAPGRGSGRYPLGSGEAAYQRAKTFRWTVAELRKSGMTQEQIAKHLQFKNTSELRSRISKNRDEIHSYEVGFAMRLKEKGMSNTKIAKRMFNDESKESTVRNLLKEGEKPKDRAFKATMDILKEELERHPYLDVGAGTELYLGVSETRLKNVLNALDREDGYSVHPYIQVEQYGKAAGQKTTVRVLTKEGVSDRDVYLHLGEIQPAGVYSEDRGETFRKIEPPRSVDSDRVYIRYNEQGGVNKDGVIELRRGVEDLSLGRANYAQVRIAVDGTHYLKGMAMYADDKDFPPGKDIIFNTNKHEGTAPEKVFKELKRTKDGEVDILNPFGASIKTEDQLERSNQSEGRIQRQRHYIDKDGKEQLSAINIVNEEGDWDTWSRNISAQMLSKQPAALAKRQLDLTYQMKREQFNDIMSLTNPTVKRKMLEDFANQCDSDAVHLQAFGFPGQSGKVILPLNSLKDNECYCPEYRSGTRVALIRYPHAGPFEIPDLIVNNNHREAKKIFGNVPDAIAINSNVAAHLSGADFDGDTVYVLPNPRGEIQTKKYLQGLQNFEPKEQYRGYEGMKVLSEQAKQKQMGIVSNLITDMTIAGAPEEDMVRAVKHSMVIIDATKHKLDWKRSEEENGIRALKEKYQVKPDGSTGGASTLISQAKSPSRVEDFRQRGYDKKTGEPIYILTGKLDKNGNPRTKEVPKMMLTDNAETLISGYNKPIEHIYANYANNMKQMAKEARQAMVQTPLLKRNPEARQQYAAEVVSLTAKLRQAQMNQPLERQALILANVKVKQDAYDNPSLKADKAAYKKLKGRTLQRMRERVGALKKRVTFTENEWKAIQSGAVSDHFLSELLKNADDDHVKNLAMPKEKRQLTGARATRVRQLINNGYTQAQIADIMDVPVSQVKAVAMEMG